MTRLKGLGSKVPAPASSYPLEAPEFQRGASPDEIEELQPDTLPSDYTFFLSHCRRVNAADIFNGYFLFSPLRVACVSASSPRLLHVPDRSRVLVEVQVIPIGGDGGGNLFLLDKAGQDQDGRVWRWCHEYPARFDGFAKEGLTLIAPSFRAFLARVAEDWEHFLVGDREWKYISG